MTKKTLEGMSRDAIEKALNRHIICAEMANGRFWEVRRNGATKLWKTRPDEFQIPVKAGLRSCGYIRHDNLANFTIKDTL